MAAAGAGLFLVLFSRFFALRPAAAQRGPPDSGALGLSLHPPYFNLAETASIRATATCGEEERGGRPRLELYCKLVGGPAAAPAGHTIQGQFCDYCNAGDPNKAHPITNAIDGTERWWQSPPLSLGLKYNEVNVTLDLGQKITAWQRVACQAFPMNEEHNPKVFSETNCASKCDALS